MHNKLLFTLLGLLLTSQSIAAEKLAAPYIVTTDHYPEPKQQPNFGPMTISFEDTDPGDTIGGDIVMHRAVNENGERINELEQGTTTYMVHWGLEVGEPGIEDDAGAGDHGGDCRGFRDTGHVVMMEVDDLDDADEIRWEIPAGTVVPQDAVYFVGHTLYGQIHNLGKCVQVPINNNVN